MTTVYKEAPFSLPSVYLYLFIIYGYLVYFYYPFSLVSLKPMRTPRHVEPEKVNQAGNEQQPPKTKNWSQTPIYPSQMRAHHARARCKGLRILGPARSRGGNWATAGTGPRREPGRARTTISVLPRLSQPATLKKAEGNREDNSPLTKDRPLPRPRL